MENFGFESNHNNTCEFCGKKYLENNKSLKHINSVRHQTALIPIINKLRAKLIYYYEKSESKLSYDDFNINIKKVYDASNIYGADEDEINDEFDFDIFESDSPKINKYVHKACKYYTRIENLKNGNY